MKHLLTYQLHNIFTGLLFLIFINGKTQSISEKNLFESEEIIQIILSGDIRSVLNDRSGKPKKHPVSLTFNKEDKSKMTLPVELQTRGNFRRKKENCNYPPLWIHFPKTGEHLNSVFGEQNKTKLLMPCQSDEYVIREWLVYKLYNLFTPLSFRARLIKVKLADPKMKKQQEPFYAMLLEEEKQLAKRNNLFAVEKSVKPQETQSNPFLMMAVFEYLIGNTDWSVQYLHNVKLLAKDDNAIPITVPYDFDHAGIVSAPYAMPAEELQMKSVRERRYRGYCVQDMKLFEAVIERFNKLKNDIYAVFNDCNLLEEKYIKATLKFLDDFYSTINNPKEWQNEFKYPCDTNGTGNIVIKGLKEN